MTPGALARLNAISHQELVQAVSDLAAHVGVTDELDALKNYQPNAKNKHPAQVMLRERELVTAALRAVMARLSEEADDEFVTPPPARAAVVREARARRQGQAA